MSDTFEPHGDRILVSPEEDDKVTKGGVILPDNVQEKPVRGTIVAVGSGRVMDSGELVPIDLNVGATVLYSKYGGTEITLNGDDYLVLRESDILGTVTTS